MLIISMITDQSKQQAKHTPKEGKWPINAASENISISSLWLYNIKNEFKLNLLTILTMNVAHILASCHNSL